MTDSEAAELRIDGHRANLREVLPEHVQRAAADHLAAALGDPELLHVLVQGDGGLLQKPGSGARVGVDQAPDRPDVRRAGTPDDDLACPGLSLRRPAPWVSSVQIHYGSPLTGPLSHLMTSSWLYQNTMGDPLVPRLPCLGELRWKKDIKSCSSTGKHEIIS